MKLCSTTDWSGVIIFGMVSGVIIFGMVLASMLLWALIRRWRTPPEDIIYEQNRDKDD